MGRALLQKIMFIQLVTKNLFYEHEGLLSCSHPHILALRNIHLASNLPLSQVVSSFSIFLTTMQNEFFTSAINFTQSIHLIFQL